MTFSHRRICYGYGAFSLLSWSGFLLLLLLMAVLFIVLLLYLSFPFCLCAEIDLVGWLMLLVLLLHKWMNKKAHKRERWRVNKRTVSSHTCEYNIVMCILFVFCCWSFSSISWVLFLFYELFIWLSITFMHKFYILIVSFLLFAEKKNQKKGDIVLE